MNMYLHELKAYKRSTAIWTVSLILVTLLLISFFPAISKDSAEFKKLLSSYPAPIRQAMSLSIESITSIMGYYGFAITYVLLLGGIQGMNLGLSILSKETRDKTADFLFSKPVSRNEIMRAKIAAAFTLVFVTNIIFTVFSYVIIMLIKDKTFNINAFLLISISAFFVSSIFLSLGIILSVIIPRIKSVITVSLSVVFGFFFLSMIGQGKGESMYRFISPFKYFDPSYIIKNSSYEARFLIFEAVFIFAAILLSFIIYNKKDVHAV